MGWITKLVEMLLATAGEIQLNPQITILEPAMY